MIERLNICRGVMVAVVAAAIGGAALLISGRPAVGADRATDVAAKLPDKVGYNRDVRPILSENCFYCHGPDKNRRKAKLRLDQRDAALAGGKSGDPAIVPGHPEKSALVERILTKDDDDLMPPSDSHKKLSDDQKEILKRWIAQGAEYQPHWAYIPPKRPEAPTVKDAAWVRNPIDAFVLHELDAHDIKPSKEADKRTLLRRLSLDLIGLPPTVEEMNAFLADQSPNAYEKQVDRLLASPHYGERMAVPWLDYVRFSDTVGFHGDQNQNVFPYRDYVINAFNKDKPFDQFTIEQLAGDLLPNPTTEQRVATCFNRLNMMTREGGAQDKEYLAKYAADRVRTLGSAFLGSTLACCECHDHKFDPFLTKDFYSLAAFWDDVKQWGIYNNYTYTPNPDLKGFTNDSPFPPEIVVDSPYLEHRIEKLRGQLDAAYGAAIQKVQGDAAARWKAQTLAFLDAHSTGWVVPAVMEGKGLSIDAARNVVEFTNKYNANDTVELKLEPGAIASIQLEAIPTAKNNGNVSRGPRDEATVEVGFAIRSGAKETKLPVAFADADHKDAIYANGYEMIGVAGGWKTSIAHDKTGQRAVYVLESPVTAAEGDRLVVSLPKNTLAAVRVSVSPIAFPAEAPADAAFVANLQSSLKAGSGFEHAFVDSTAPSTSVRQVERQILDCRGGKSPVLTTVAVKPKVTRVLPRGNWQDDSGAVVVPATPAFLTHSTSDRRLTRLDLAKWLVSPENPLVARTFVNRLWKQYFGAGICNSVEDLGAQGEYPSHPELLDWLATEFENGWDVKHVVRLIVTSSTYRQDSNLRPDVLEIDPANRLLASQNPRRLEAEFVRDNALAAAGLINLDDIGGPSVKPYQPAGYYANIQFPNRDYVADTDDREYRRGVYMHWQRTFLHPMLANFDAPSREDAVCTRNVSNTPQQALTLLNDPEFVEAARVLAAKVWPGGDDVARLERVYERVLGRSIKAKERASLTKFLGEQRAYYKEHPDDAAKLLHVGLAKESVAGADDSELAAWTTVCRVVLNLHESITRY